MGETWGAIEQYHRQLLIPVAIEPNSMSPLVLVKENNVNNNNNNNESIVITSVTIVSSTDAIRLSESRKRPSEKQRFAKACIVERGWKKKEK